MWQPTTAVTPPSATGKTYYVNGATGSNSNNGLSPSTAFATPQQAANVVQAGDTVLIAAGIYHSTIYPKVSGAAGKPITFGSDGSGPAIIDGSTPVTGWTQLSGTVWTAPINFTPIAVVVNNTPLKPSQSGVSGVTSGSGLWYASGGILTVDFGSTMGTANPSTADIVVPNNNGAQTVVYFYNNNYLTFNGLTVRGSGAGGIWGYGSNIIVSNCNLEFNGKAGVNFMAMQGNANANNQVLYSRVANNVLLNWPRGNNGFADAGGGWSGGLAFTNSLNGVARGNVVYDNGGEGIISYGSSPGTPTGGTLFEQNVAFDNWSVNMYFDNQPNDIARQNILFNHPMNTNDWLKPPSAGYPWNQLYKYSVGLMLADEYNSSGGSANLANTQVYPAGHPKLLHLWPVKLPQAGRSDYAYSAAVAMREAASFRR
uniref:Right handed beta helix domain-containing protein n=1 Tax=mine drainage metagenome TaxID=410659 RepID=E6PUZ5_9ZZZZ